MAIVRGIPFNRYIRKTQVIEVPHKKDAVVLLVRHFGSGSTPGMKISEKVTDFSASGYQIPMGSNTWKVGTLQSLIGASV